MAGAIGFYNPMMTYIKIGSQHVLVAANLMYKEK